MREGFYAAHFALEDWHWWFRGRSAVLRALLDRRLAPPPAGRERRILDLGCGTGAMLSDLSRYGSARGVDPEPEAVRLCRERGLEGVELLEGLPVPVGDGELDLVTMLDVLEHADDDRTLLDEAKRLLRPGGQLLVSVPAYRFLWGAQDEVAEHRRRYRARELRQRIEGSGLAVEWLSYCNTTLFPAVAAVRLLGLRKGSRRTASDFSLNRPGRLNDALARAFAAEAPVVARVGLPFGVSIVALARRP